MRPAVQRWGDLALHHLAEHGEVGGQDHAPHLGVDVVQEHDPGLAWAQRGDRNGIPFQISTRPSRGP